MLGHLTGVWPRPRSVQSDMGEKRISWELSTWRALRVQLDRWFRGFLMGGVVLGLASAITAAWITPGDEPGLGDRLTSGALGFLIALAFTFVVAAAIGVPVALVRQRNSARAAIEKRDSAIARLEDKTLRLQFNALAATWVAPQKRCRVSLEVKNLGQDGRFTARLMRPVIGIDRADYGAIPLQWDVLSDWEMPIGTNETVTLHVAGVTTPRRTLNFYGPQTAASGENPQTIYADCTPEPVVQVVIEFRDLVNGGCCRQRVDIEIDHENVPSIKLGSSAECI